MPMDSSEFYAIIVVILSFLAYAYTNGYINLEPYGLKASKSVTSSREEDPPPRKANKKAPVAASSTFRAIPDQFTSIGEVRTALRNSGLESSGLVVAIDFTKSNTWTGERSFGGRCLHELDTPLPGAAYRSNPYQTCIASLGRTLGDLDEENEIPAYGFGDLRTKDHSVFPFKEDGTPCRGLQDVLESYAAQARTVKMSGPTSFAPAIKEALGVVQKKQGYHVLIIVADGQVTDEAETTEAIIEASKYPLSIVVVGVGDGPWDQMEDYDDNLPAREFDNFQFVNFTEVEARSTPDSFDAALALACLQELPEQYKELRKQGKLRRIQDKDTGPSEARGSVSSAVEGGGGGSPPVEPPDNYLCPVTQELMVDPVMAEDGYAYERAAIERWFTQKQSNTGRQPQAPSPMGNYPIGLKLIPNNALRSEVMEWRQRNPQEVEIID